VIPGKTLAFFLWKKTRIFPDTHYVRRRLGWFKKNLQPTQKTKYYNFCIEEREQIRHFSLFGKKPPKKG